MTGRALLFFLALAPARAAPNAATSGLDATASCERRATKGRVICDVELELGAGRIAWADIVVKSAPAFAPPLRARVALSEARTRTARRVRIPVALVATRTGRGVVEMRARAAVCNGEGRAETCLATYKDVRADLVVGADIER